MPSAVASPETPQVSKPPANAQERQQPVIGSAEQQTVDRIHQGGDVDQILRVIAEEDTSREKDLQEPTQQPTPSPETPIAPQQETSQGQENLLSINVEGRRLAGLIYTPEGQQVVDETQQVCSQIVDIQAESSKSRLSESQLEDAVTYGRNLNAELLARWQQRKQSRTQELLKGAHMTDAEQRTYLKLELGYEPLPTKDPAEIERRTALLDHFAKTRRDVGKAIRYQRSELVRLEKRPVMFSEGALRFYGIPTINAQESFARGWNEIKKISRRVAETQTAFIPEVDNSEIRAATEMITGTSLNAFLHEPVQFSAYGEIKADFVRFTGRVGDRLFLGTNHEATDSEIQLVDTYVQDILSRGITTAYIEQGGLTAQDNLDKWLEENGYLVDERGDIKMGELAHLTQSLTEKGIKVVNMDLAHNPSALPFAMGRFGLERTARALNRGLSLEAESLDINGPRLDRNKIPEIITRLLSEAGGNVDQQQIAIMIQGRSAWDNDNFSDAEREEYMVRMIKDQRAAIAAHSAHTSALLSRISGNQLVENLDFQIDSDKLARVMVETNGNSNDNSYSQAA